MRTQVLVTPLTIAIELYVSNLILRPLILKTSTIYEFHILFVSFVTVDIYSLYILYKGNMLLERPMNTVQLDFNFIYLLFF